MLRAPLNTRTLRLGSSRVVPSRIGRRQAPCCGSMESVRRLVRWFSLTDSLIAGSGKSILRHVYTLACPSRQENSLFYRVSRSSAIIQDIERVSNAGLASMAYFYFDFKDIGKQDFRALLASLLIQLCDQSDSFCNVLLRLYSAHRDGSQQPSDAALVQSLKKMIIAGTVPIYLIIDALDECPDTSGLQSSREKVLELVEDLLESHNPNLRLCATSRPEIDIRTSLEQWSSESSCISLHDQTGQKEDILNYIRSVVYSDRKMKN